MAERRPASERPVKTGLFVSPYDPSGIEQEVSYIADELLVKYREDASPEQIAALEREFSLELFGGDDEFGSGSGIWYFYQIMSPADALVVSKQLGQNPLVEFAEPNFVRTPEIPIVDYGPDGLPPQTAFRPTTGEPAPEVGSAIALIALSLVLGG